MSKKPQSPPDPGHELPRGAASYDSGEPPEEDARWKRPNDARNRDRFPTLPDETPATAPLREPPRRRPTPPSDSRANARDRSRNLIALFFLLATCGVFTYFVVIWQNPYSALNPLAPPTPLPLVITATLTPTLTTTPPPTRTPRPTDTPSPIPSDAPTMTFTPVFLEGMSTPEVTEDTSTYRFTLQRDRVVYLTNPDARGGCRWSSIAGSVMSYAGSALDGYGVHVFGEGVDQTVATGSATGFGPGGFEVPLGNTARDARYSAQLIDPQGIPVSRTYTVETNSDCAYNIAALRFVETSPSS